MATGIIIPDRSGYFRVKSTEILLLEAESNYCHIYLEDGKKHFVAKTLKSFLADFDNSEFIRVHRKYLLNKKFIRGILRGKLMAVLLSNGQVITVSRAHRSQVLKLVRAEYAADQNLKYA